MRFVIRHLVANARVFSEAVLYHGSLRFLAMNPAVLVSHVITRIIRKFVNYRFRSFPLSHFSTDLLGLFV